MDFKKLEKMDNLIVCGDIHGKFREFGYRIKNWIDDGIVIVAGDIGMGFHKPNYYRNEFAKLNKILQTKNVYVFFIRGNHDDPEYFKNDTPINNEFSNIKLVPDYYTLKTGAGNVLCVGGAISIDRSQRTIGINYWPNENCTYEEKTINELKEKIDIVVTHSAPSHVKPFHKGAINSWTIFDKTLISDCSMERYFMNNIYEQLKETGHNIKYWVYGHFHMSNQMDYEKTRFICCNELEFVELNKYIEKKL